MKNSPFVYGTTVSGRSFTNREEELERLVRNLTQGINTTIISPRRWGKSSLVERAIKDIQVPGSKTKVVSMDLFSASSEEEFLELFAREVIRASTPKWQEWIASGKEFFKQLIPKINVGIDPQQDFSLSFDWDELKRHRQEVLNLPEEIATRKGVQFVICIDEFQELATFPQFIKIEKQLRSIWQRQKKCTYCLYGSKKHMMSEIFNDPSKPFYRFGDLMHLGKISRERWISFIQGAFKRSGKRIDGPIAAIIPDTMNNHSWYVQQLAHYTWNRVDSIATSTEVELATKELLQANLPLYQKEVERISRTQINMLKAIAMGEQQLSSSRVMHAYQLGSTNNVTKNKRKLQQADLIDKSGGGFEFLDPAFELWFKRVFNK